MIKYFPYGENENGIISWFISKIGVGILDEITVNISNEHDLSIFQNSSLLFFPNDINSFCSDMHEDSPYIDITFVNNFVALTNYMLRFTLNANRMRTWSLYGSNNSLDWYEIDNQALAADPGPSTIMYFQVKEIGYYSRLRFRQRGKSWANLNYICMEKIEFYGYLRVPNSVTNKRAFLVMANNVDILLIDLILLC